MINELFDISKLLGPLGGTLALTWGAGAASGYYFAMKTLKEKIKFLQRQIELSDENCDHRIKALDERYEDEIRTLKSVMNNYKEQIDFIQKNLFENDK